MNQVEKFLAENCKQGFFNPCEIFTEEQYNALYRNRLPNHENEQQNPAEGWIQCHIDISEMTGTRETQDPQILVDLTIIDVNDINKNDTSQLEVEQSTVGMDLDNCEALPEPFVHPDEKPNDNSNVNKSLVRSRYLKPKHKSNGSISGKIKRCFLSCCF